MGAFEAEVASTVPVRPAETEKLEEQDHQLQVWRDGRKLNINAKLLAA